MLKRILLALPLLLAGVLWAQTANPPAPSSAAPPLIILIGPPLSGKTTLADSITRTYGVPNISVEDLIKDHAAELEHLRGQGMSMAEMRYDPAMSRYLRERLKTADLSHGLALDGYPATLVQAEDLAKMVPGLNLKPIAFQLQVPDDVIRERSKNTGRGSDSSRILEQRIKDYHREMDAISLYFPNANIVAVDANKPEAEVWKAIQAGLDGAGVKPLPKEADLVTDEATIKSAISGFINAYNNGDIEGVLACYADDLIKVRNGAPPETKLETGKRVAAVFEKFHSRVDVVIDEIQVSGNLAYTRGSFRVTLSPKAGGDPQVVERRYLEIWHKDRGRWLVARTMDNAG
jgi:adenylate kinase family enzyme/ketosteroid isomerase-like protein